MLMLIGADLSSLEKPVRLLSHVKLKYICVLHFTSFLLEKNEDRERQYRIDATAWACGMRKTQMMLAYSVYATKIAYGQKLVFICLSFSSLRFVSSVKFGEASKPMHVRYINWLMFAGEARDTTPANSDCIHHRAPETDQYHVRRLANEIMRQPISQLCLCSVFIVRLFIRFSLAVRMHLFVWIPHLYVHVQCTNSYLGVFFLLCLAAVESALAFCIDFARFLCKIAYFLVIS